MRSPINIAVVGTGFGQKVHIPGLQAQERIQVVAVYNQDAAKAQSIAQTYNIPHSCTSLEEVVALKEVQAVSISTPPFLHYEMAKTVLQAGKHLLLEKPTTLSAVEARKLYNIAAKQNVVATLDFEFRFVPAWQYLAELLAAEYVGQQRLIKIDWLVPSRADATKPWNWYAQKDLGGGALGALGSHTFDYISWLFGDVERLCAHLSTAVSLRPDPISGKIQPVDADDSCMLILELANGVPCQVTISACTYQGRGHWVESDGARGPGAFGSTNR